MAERPNILLITADGMRYDALRCNGNERAESPVLDTLADQGVRFGRAYCSQPICMPCRSTIMTGRYPSSHGVWQNGVPLDPSIPNLPTLLGEAGYRTACYGKFHFQPWLNTLEPDEGSHQSEYLGDGPYYGFDSVRVTDHSQEDRYFDWVAEHHPHHLELARNPRSEAPRDAKIAWKSSLPREVSKSQYTADLNIAALHRLVESPDAEERPFFLWASFIDPHHPYAPPAPYCDMFDDVEFPRPPLNDGPPEWLPQHYHVWAERLDAKWGHKDTAQRHWQQVRRMYQGEVAHVDYQIGRVLEVLRELGQWDNTIVIYLSDHGTMLGDFGLMQVGEYSQEPLVHVPMIWRVPGARMNGGQTQALASTVDVLPTLFDYLDVEIPLGVQGKSLRKVLEGRAPAVREQVMIEQRWGQDPPEGFNTLVTDRYKLSVCRNGEEGELYDLLDDPLETRNLFDDPAAAEIQAELMHRFASEMLTNANRLPRRIAAW